MKKKLTISLLVAFVLLRSHHSVVQSESSSYQVALMNGGSEDLWEPAAYENVTNPDCEYFEPPFLDVRFWLVSGLGTLVALVSILHNSILSFFLLRSDYYRCSHQLYLALLAVCDSFIAGAYIPLMSINLLADRLQSPTLLNAWFSYMIPMITISHIAMTASSFLIVAASFERYCLTIHPQVTHQEECSGTMLEYGIDVSDFALNYIYNSIWRLFFRSIFTVLTPFFLLAFMNLRIVLHIQNPRESDYLKVYELNESKRKSRIRAATRTLVLVVFTYLLSNILNVVITIWEYIDYANITIDHQVFYLFAVDVVSILTTFAGALRLPIYLTCQPQLRKELLATWKMKFFCSKNLIHSRIKNEPADRNDYEDPEEERREETGQPYRDYTLILTNNGSSC